MRLSSYIFEPKLMNRRCIHIMYCRYLFLSCLTAFLCHVFEKFNERMPFNYVNLCSYISTCPQLICTANYILISFNSRPDSLLLCNCADSGDSKHDICWNKRVDGRCIFMEILDEKLHQETLSLSFEK